jgi:hypothetical protein
MPSSQMPGEVVDFWSEHHLNNWANFHLTRMVV